MEMGTASSDNLRLILKNIRNPEALDDHPWTRSLVVQEMLSANPQAAPAGPGQQLVYAIAHVFADMQPPTPPRRGKRLDPRWGEFGLLAALYFTPFNHGTPFPTSLLDAWKRIDSAILYHVYGKSAGSLSEEEIQKYRLVGADIEFGSASTLSDWHKKGVQRLADILVNRERFLSTSSKRPSTLLGDVGMRSATPEPVRRTSITTRKRTVWLAVCAVLCAILILGGVRMWGVYTTGRAVYENVTHLKGLVKNRLDVGSLDAAYPSLNALQQDLSTFKEEAKPLLWLGPRLGWIPVYGDDIASAPGLIELAERLIAASDIVYQASGPLARELNSQNSSLEPAELTALLVAAQPQFAHARVELDRALEARRNIDAERLSPRLQNLLVDEIDPILELADDGLHLVTALPILLGATPEGPKTYLLLAQNEDELRSTGGFITSVGRLVLHNGQVISLEFEQVDDQEDWSKPYPPAPWQMRQYMNSRVILLRDANWFTDYPTAARWAEYLYAYTHSHSVDGVIAFDQQFLVMLLGKMGPLEVEGAPYPITSENVIGYMRSAKTLPAGEPVPEGWHRKEFITRMTGAILTELMTGRSHNWRGIAATLLQALSERHLLLQFDDPVIASLIAKQGWDNSIQPGTGDFLMVTDTNMGFNKTNAVVDVSLIYEVDLTNPSNPLAALVVTHTNRASPGVPCIHWNTGQISGESSYPMDRCYWNYLRVYKQAGTDLLDASPHAVPGEWMLLGRDVPARVDDLEEDVPGIRGFGTLLVIPGGKSVDTGFRFKLPPETLSRDESTGQITYRFHMQKQPGTLAIPIAIKIMLPAEAVLLSISTDSTSLGNHILVNTDLRTDVEFDVVFSLSETGQNP